VASIVFEKTYEITGLAAEVLPGYYEQSKDAVITAAFEVSA
jgi:hypothetical protein